MAYDSTKRARVMIVEVFKTGDEIGAKIMEGDLIVVKACADCNYVVKEGSRTVAYFKSAIEFSEYMSSCYGELGEEMAGLLCWLLVDYLDDEEIGWLLLNNETFLENLVEFWDKEYDD